MTAVLKSKNQPNNMLSVLNQSLASAIDLKLQAKQAHWNVKGENFLQLHELFDKVSGEVDDFADLIAERVVQLGGNALGTVQAVSETSSLPPYAMDMQDGQQHVVAMCKAVSAVTEEMRLGIDIATERGDTVTADIFTEVTRGLDKLRWYIEAHAK